MLRNPHGSRSPLRWNISLRALLITVAALATAVGLVGRRIRITTQQREALALLDAEFDNQPWVAVKYYGNEDYESPLERSVAYDFLHDIESVRFTDVPVDDALGQLHQLPAINDLEMIHTDVTDLGLERLCSAESLTRITINDGFFSDNGLLRLSALPHLKQLRASRYPPLGSDALDEFRKRRADVQVVLE